MPSTRRPRPPKRTLTCGPVTLTVDQHGYSAKLNADVAVRDGRLQIIYRKARTS